MNKKELKRFVALFIMLIIVLTANSTFAISVTEKSNSTEKTNIENMVKTKAVTSNILNNNNFLVKQEKEQDLTIQNENKIKKSQLRGALKAPSDVNEEISYSLEYPNIQEVRVEDDLQNDYYISNEIYETGQANINLIKHNIKNNENKIIYTYNNFFSPKQFVRGSVIYFEVVDFVKYDKEGSCTGIRIIGYDVLKNEVVYNNYLGDLTLKKEDIFHSFVVDSKERVYIEYENKAIRAYNKDGSLLFDNKHEELDGLGVTLEVVLHNVAPNDDGVVFSLGIIWTDNTGTHLKTVYEGYQKLNSNGTFKYSEYTIFESGNTSYVLDPNWKFISNDGMYAVNQYGQIGKFTYVEANDENMCGVEIQIIDSAYRQIIDSYYGNLLQTVYFVKDGYLYIIGNEGIIRIFDMNNNFKSLGILDTNITLEKDNINGEFIRITNIDNDIYVHYYDYSGSTAKDLYKIISLDSFKENENIWITEFATQEHKQTEISNKYNESLPKFNYEEGLYEITPTWKSPYTAGKLKQGPIDDTLNRLNFQRWLYGVNSVTIREDKLERNQKGAVILAATNTLTHTPTKPADMDEDFYKEAYAACYYGATPGDMYNGNCAQGQKNPAGTIDGFIDEIYNVSPGSNVGHRLNLLDLDVNKTSFGYCNGFTTLSMFYNENGSNNNNEEFYLYPTAGNFPMQLFNTSEYFSIYIKNAYNIHNMKIDFEYNGITYNQIDFHTEQGNTIVFKLPKDLIDVLGGENKYISKECKLNVKIKNLEDKYGNATNLDYDINFYDVKNPQDELGYKAGDVDKNGVINATDYAIIARYLKGYEDLTEEQIKLADVDKNGTVNATDYAKIARYLKGYENI